MRLDDVKISDKAFNEIKSIAIKLWNTHDNSHGYVDELVDDIIDLPSSPWNMQNNSSVRSLAPRHNFKEC
jgi:hypothetical protein